jgi:hypothetical protein
MKAQAKRKMRLLKTSIRQLSIEQMKGVRGGTDTNDVNCGTNDVSCPDSINPSDTAGNACFIDMTV